MKVQVVFTLNELKKVTPSLTREHFFMECPEVKEALKELFWRLGVQLKINLISLMVL